MNFIQFQSISFSFKRFHSMSDIHDLQFPVQSISQLQLNLVPWPNPGSFASLCSALEAHSIKSQRNSDRRKHTKRIQKNPKEFKRYQKFRHEDHYELNAAKECQRGKRMNLTHFKPDYQKTIRDEPGWIDWSKWSILILFDPMLCKNDGQSVAVARKNAFLHCHISGCLSGIRAWPIQMPKKTTCNHQKYDELWWNMLN